MASGESLVLPGLRRKRVSAVLVAWLGLAGGAYASENCRQGYRQLSVISDFALGREWAVYSSCTHPEQPGVAILVGQSSDRPPSSDRAVLNTSAAGSESPSQLMVRVGSPVRLWLRSSTARIELSAVALESGAAGATIRVRVAPRGRVLYGTVRAAGSVELLAAGFSGNQVDGGPR